MNEAVRSAARFDREQAAPPRPRAVRRRAARVLLAFSLLWSPVGKGAEEGETAFTALLPVATGVDTYLQFDGHWTVDGHEVVAEALDGCLPR